MFFDEDSIAADPVLNGEILDQEQEEQQNDDNGRAEDKAVDKDKEHDDSNSNNNDSNRKNSIDADKVKSTDKATERISSDDQPDEVQKIIEKEEEASQRRVKRRKLKGELSYDIEEMMYGFGDSWPPDEKSVELVDSIVTSYIEDIAMQASKVAEFRGSAIDKNCFLFAVRKNRQKFDRYVDVL